MSIVAGILNRRPDTRPSIAVSDNLQRAVSRHLGEDVTVFRDRNVALFKVDVGAFGEPGFHSELGGSVTMLAGEPLLEIAPDVPPEGRYRDLQRLHDAFDREQWDLFSRTRGTYCAVHWEPATATLSLIADRLGLRPIYYWIGPDHVIFASALRILETVAEVPKVMDLVAVTEIAALGYPVGNRTPFAGISGLKAGEILRFTHDRARSLRYWRWDSIKSSIQPERTQLENAYDQFRRAVRLRLAGDTAVFASLSGGLDSRCVVAALRSESVEVHSLNFYTELESQEQVFAAEFAQRAGTVHRAVRPTVGGSFDERVTDVRRASPPVLAAVPEHPQLWWMGEGGSVGLGHVYVDRTVVAALRAGDLQQAIGAWNQITPKLMKSEDSKIVREMVVEDIRTALDDLRYDDPGRSFHVFLMLYEQRYDLAQHFENVDLHRMEWKLPFFDADFFATIVSAPVDLCLAHGFYTDWLGLFPPSVTAVPWQAYPGHRPCPLPVPAGLAYQWDKARPASEVDAKRRRLLAVADQVLRADRFPDAILSKRYLRLARWMCKAGLHRGQGTIEVAELFDRYWAKCLGRFVAGPATTVGQ